MPGYMMTTTGRKNTVEILVLFAVPLIFVLAYVLPSYPRLLLAPACGFKMMTGIECPGCGMTRSFAALVHGRVRESINAHPLGIVLALWLAYNFGRATSTTISGISPRALITPFGRDIIVGAFLAAVLFQWIVRLVTSFLSSAL